jgi:adenylate kinase
MEEFILHMLSALFRRDNKRWCCQSHHRSFCVLLVFQLDAMLETQGHKVDKVLNFNVEDSVLEERITGRWIHPGSGRSYHSKFAPPKVPGIDDISGEPLIQRKDDTAEVLKSRLDAFHKQTTPVIAYYSQKGIVVDLQAEKPAKEVTSQIEKALS